MFPIIIGAIGFITGGIVGTLGMAIIAATTRPDADPYYRGLTDDDLDELMAMVNDENPKD